MHWIQPTLVSPSASKPGKLAATIPFPPKAACPSAPLPTHADRPSPHPVSWLRWSAGNASIPMGEIGRTHIQMSAWRAWGDRGI